MNLNFYQTHVPSSICLQLTFIDKQLIFGLCLYGQLGLFSKI